MSCWMRVNIKVMDNIEMSILEKTVCEMGYMLNHSIKEVSNGFESRTERVDAALQKDSRVLSLGFAFINGGAELRGDFWKTGLRQEEFINTLSQTYQKNNIQAKMEEYGAYFDTIETQEDGSIVMECSMA